MQQAKVQEHAWFVPYKADKSKANSGYPTITYNLSIVGEIG